MKLERTQGCLERTKGIRTSTLPGVLVGLRRPDPRPPSAARDQDPPAGRLLPPIGARLAIPSGAPPPGPRPVRRRPPRAAGPRRPAPPRGLGPRPGTTLDLDRRGRSSGLGGLSDRPGPSGIGMVGRVSPLVLLPVVMAAPVSALVAVPAVAVRLVGGWAASQASISRIAPVCCCSGWRPSSRPPAAPGS
jgi:hypothetical protein